MKILNQSFLYFIFIICHFVSQSNYGQKINDSLSYYYSLAINPKTSDNLPLAFKFYNRLKDRSFKKKDTINAIYALRFSAVIQKELGYLNDSELSAIEALKLLDNLSINEVNIESKLGLLNHLGIVYRLLYNYEKALDFYDNALEIAKKPEDSITIFNNKANVYIDKKEYTLAIQELQKAYLKSKKNNNIQTALVLDNLGYAKSKLNFPNALSNMLEALDIREKQKNFKGIYTSYSNLSKYYHENNSTEKSKYYANKAYNLAKQINSVSYIEDALSNLVSFNSDSIIIEYKKLKDSLTKAREVSRNAYAFNKYNYEKNEKELLKIQFTKERDKIIYISLVIFILILSIITYFLLKTKHKKDKLQEVYTTENRISQKVHDELANDIYHVINNIQNKPNTNDVLNKLESIYARTRDISYENSTINVDNNYYYLELKDMISCYQNAITKISTIGLTQDIFNTANIYKKITLERVLKELLTNMKKHSKATQVVITFKKEKRHINIYYVDNGIGIKKTQQFKNNGLQNVENRIKNINGSVIFDFNREHGIGITISFPT